MPKWIFPKTSGDQQGVYPERLLFWYLGYGFVSTFFGDWSKNEKLLSLSHLYLPYLIFTLPGKGIGVE